MKSKIWNSKRVFITVIGLVALGLLVFVAPDYTPDYVLNTAVIATALATATAVFGISLEDMRRAGEVALYEFTKVDKTGSVLEALVAGGEAFSNEMAARLDVDRETFDKVVLAVLKYVQDKRDE